MGKFNIKDENFGNADVRYVEAYKRMKRIKSFYIHLVVYLIFNTIIIAINHYDTFPTSEFWTFETFSLAIYWGIGLLFHGISVFGKNALFSQKWEEKKIKEFMQNDSKTQKWE